MSKMPSSSPPKKKAKLESVRWIDDADGSLKLVHMVEKMRTNKMTVKQFVSTFQKVRNHPVALACLADKVSKSMGNLDVEYASSIFGAHAEAVMGTGTEAIKLSTLFNQLADMEDGTIASDMDVTLKFLPKNVSVGDWCNAIMEAFGNNSCYCRGVGRGTTNCADFVRLAAPLKKPKKCKVADLIPLFWHLWDNPFIAASGWDEEMQQLHDNYNIYIQNRPWLYRALDPGFVVIEGMAVGALANAMANVPIAAPAGPAPVVIGIQAAPVGLPNLTSIYQVADLAEARLTAMHVSGANSGVHGFGVGTALGNTFIF